MNENEPLDPQLDALFRELGVERAPASLTRRLRRIPQEHGASQPWWARLLAPPSIGWVAAPALAAVLAVAVVLLMQPRQPSPEQVLQARHDVAVAFGYIDRVGLRTGREIHNVLDAGVREPVKDNLSRHIPFTEPFRKEETS